MKYALTILAILLILVPAAGQKLRSKGYVPIPNSFSSGSSVLESLGNDRFALLSRLDHENLLTVYNIDHEELFSIKLNRTTYYPLFNYVASLDAIVVFVNDQDDSAESKKNALRCIVKLYSATNGKLIAEKELQKDNAEAASLTYSENNEFFCISNSALPDFYDVYRSSDFKKINTFGRELTGHESFVTMRVSNAGEGLLVHKNQNSYLFFNFYDSEGNLKNTVEGGRDLQSNQNYSASRFVQDTDQNGYLVFARSYPKYMTALDIWKIDFESSTAGKSTTFELNKDNIRNRIYERTYARAELDPTLENYGNTPVSREKGPSKLKNVILNSVHSFTNGGLVVVLEEVNKRVGSRDPALRGISDFHRMEYTDYYTGKDVMVIGFDAEGANTWACAYERMAATKSPAYGQYKSSFPIFSPGYSGVHTVGRSAGNRLHLINYEYRLLGKYGPYYRCFDMTTGKLLYDRPLLDEDKHTVNSKYVDLVGDKCMVLVTKTGIDFYITQDKIQLVSVDLP